MEANSYKRSVREEFQKNEDLHNTLDKLKREQDNSRINYKIYLDQCRHLKEEYIKLMRITEFETKTLNTIMLVYNIFYSSI